jgi:hypothetical protein
MYDNMDDAKFNARCKMWAEKLMIEVAAGRIDNEWAETFICDMSKKTKAGITLTHKQHDKLEELFTQY